MNIKRIVLIGLVCAGIAAVGVAGFLFGYRYGEESPKILVVRGVGNIDPSATSTVDFGTFWEAWDLIDRSYYKPNVATGQKKVYGAIQGLVRSLGDPNSEFYNPEDNKKFFEDIQGNFGGIGAEIGIRQGQIVVVAPLKDTPAMRAGLKAGDRIFKVDATSTEGFSVDQAVRIIRGPKGTEVTLTVFRDEWERTREITVARDTIVVPTLDSTMKEGGILHVQLYNFNANAHRLFYDAIVKAIPQGVKGMVFDLRNNPGGFLEVSVDLAGWFLPRGTLVVKEEGQAVGTEEFRAEGNEALVKLPVVILVNEGSASAAEILAGALRANRGIKLIGQKTFGKGTVQQVLALQDGSSVKLTVARWVLPDGSSLDKEGLSPDISVELAEDDIKSGRDPQLEKALEVLKSEISKSISNV